MSLRPATMPLSLRGRDEKALQSRRRTHQRATSKGARAETPQCAEGAPQVPIRPLLQRRRKSLGLLAIFATRWSSRPQPRRCFRSSAGRQVIFSPCFRPCWRTRFAFATPSSDISTAGTASLARTRVTQNATSACRGSQAQPIRPRPDMVRTVTTKLSFTFADLCRGRGLH